MLHPAKIVRPELARPPAPYSAQRRREGGDALYVRSIWEVYATYAPSPIAQLYAASPDFVVEGVGLWLPIGLGGWRFPELCGILDMDFR